MKSAQGFLWSQYFLRTEARSWHGLGGNVPALATGLAGVLNGPPAGSDKHNYSQREPPYLRVEATLHMSLSSARECRGETQ